MELVALFVVFSWTLASRSFDVVAGRSLAYFDLMAFALATYALASLTLTAWRGLREWQNSAREVPRLRRLLIFNWLRRYFAFRVAGEDRLPDGPVLYVLHPHGFVPVSASLGFMLHGDPPPFRRAPEVLVATNRLFFPIPFLRDFLVVFGSVDASRENLLNVLKSGRSVALLAGGGREMGMCHDGRLLYGEHDGFARLAKEAGVPIVPTFCHGECDPWFLYKPFPRLLRWVVSRGGGVFPILFFGPLPARVTMEFGQPVDSSGEAAGAAALCRAEISRLSGGGVEFVSKERWKDEVLNCSFVKRR